MYSLTHRTSSRALALGLVLAAGCENQITQPPVHSLPSEAIHADKAPFKSVFVLEPLPVTSGTSYSSAYGINDLGQVVGESGSSAGNRAVIWDNSTVPLDLGLLPGGTSSSAEGISNDGRVIAGVSGDGFTNSPVRWLNSNGQWVIDALYNAGGLSCWVTGISADGTAIVGNCGQYADVWVNGSRISLGLGSANGVNAKGQAVGGNSTGDHALLWNFGTLPVTVTDLGTLGGTYAYANSINDAGEVTGWSENADHVSHAFLWSPKRNAMTDLGPVGTTSGGYGINATGQVVGDLWPNYQHHAAFFDHGKVVDLGVLPGYTEGAAFKLNNTGRAVGWSRDNSSLQRATEWILK